MPGLLGLGLGLFHGGLTSGDVRLPEAQPGLVGLGIELGQHLARLHPVIEVRRDRSDLARDLRADLDRDQGFYDPGRRNGLDKGTLLDLPGPIGRGLGLGAAAAYTEADDAQEGERQEGE